MTKRFMILAGCLCLALLTNLSFRVPPSVQAQAACQTFLAPTFTLGTQKNLPVPGGVLKDGDLFYLGANNGVQFTALTSNFSVFRPATDFAINPGFPNTTLALLASDTPNVTATTVSCLDSFWDISFVLYGGAANVAGDRYEFYLQQPNGSGRIRLVEFQNNPAGTGTTVTYIVPGGDLSAVGHTPTIVGRVIPFEIAGGLGNQRTQLITLALPMDGSIPNCAQLGINIVKANGNGRAQIALVNMQVNRGASTTASGTGLFTGQTGTYPTALVCDKICPNCATLNCDETICFAEASTWCNRLPTPHYNRKPFRVVIPDTNGNMPINVFLGQRVNPQVQAALGCGGYERLDINSQITAAYVAAQLSVQNELFYWYVKLGRQQLGCHIRVPMAMPNMPAPPKSLPAKFSNGVTLDDFSSLEDLFSLTEWVVGRGNADDCKALLAIYRQLNDCSKD
jgi:hypothetical protein